MSCKHNPHTLSNTGNHFIDVKVEESILEACLIHKMCLFSDIVAVLSEFHILQNKEQLESDHYTDCVWVSCLSDAIELTFCVHQALHFYLTTQA